MITGFLIGIIAGVLFAFPVGFVFGADYTRQKKWKEREKENDKRRSTENY